MKKIINLLIFLFCFSVYGSSDTLLMSNRSSIVYKLLDEYIEEGKKRGLVLDKYLSYNLHSVTFLSKEQMEQVDWDRVEDDGELLGRIFWIKQPTGIKDYYSYRIHIVLLDGLLNDPYLVRMVLWHELGHLFGLTHTESDFDIMNSETALKKIDEGIWQRYNDLYWFRIRISNKQTWLAATRNDL